MRSSRTESKVVSKVAQLLSGLDLTQAFKTKGDLKRWSAKRTIGGSIVLTACHEILETGCTWPLVTLCAVGVLPLCLSFFEPENNEG